MGEFRLRGGTRVCDFVLSDREVDIIQGPLGSGKTRALCARVMRHAQQQRVSPVTGLRMSRWAMVRNCYDDETEILTEGRGWVLFKDLIEGERVAQLRNGVLEFVAPTYYYRAPYVGELVGFEGEGVDFRVTPDHRMWVSKLRGRKREWGDFEFRLARDIFGNSDFRVARSAKWVGEDVGRSVEFCEWLGFFFAEGSAGVYRCGDGVTRWQCVITQIKPEGAEYGRRLFVAAGLPMSEHARPDNGVTLRLRTTASTRGLIDDLAGMGKATTKAVPEWLKRASPGHIRAFIKGFIAGDGHVRANGVTTAYTSSKALADDLQELALRCGMVANVSSRDRVGQAIAVGGGSFITAVEWAVTFVRDAKHRPRLKRGGYAGRYRGWYKEQYRGEVFCIEVPTHVVYVRRNGKAFWCSQTYPDLRRTTIRTWLEMFPEQVYGRFNWGQPPVHKLRFGDVFLEVDFFALDKAEDISKLRSTEYTGVAFNEIPFIEKEIFDEAHSRLRYPGADHGGSEWHGVIADANAPDEDHWLALMTGQVDFPPNMTDEERMQFAWPAAWGFHYQPPAVLERLDRNGRVTGYMVNSGAENLENLPKGYYDKMIPGKSKAWIDSRLRNVVALVVEGSAVWPMFKTDVHVATEALRPVPGHNVIVGLDFGRQPAAIFGQTFNNRVYVQYELLGFNEGASVFAPKVKRFLETHYRGYRVEIFGDPKGADKGQGDERTAYDIFASMGMTVVPAPVKQNMIETRVDAVGNVLNEMTDGRPRFVLSPLCRTLKVAMAGRYHLVKEEDGELKPKKDRYSNPADALQYMMLGMGEGRRLIGLEAVSRARPVQTNVRRRSLRRVV